MAVPSAGQGATPGHGPLADYYHYGILAAYWLPKGVQRKLAVGAVFLVTRLAPPSPLPPQCSGTRKKTTRHGQEAKSTLYALPVWKCIMLNNQKKEQTFLTVRSKGVSVAINTCSSPPQCQPHVFRMCPELLQLLETA